MTKPAVNILIGILVFLIIIVLLNSFYVVAETNQVIITQFGEPIGNAITKPGLHMKVPFIQKANYFEKRWLEWDGDANEIPTKDKKYIWVDTYARWRISDPLVFFQRLRDERNAQSRIDDFVVNLAAKWTLHKSPSCLQVSNRTSPTRASSSISLDSASA